VEKVCVFGQNAIRNDDKRMLLIKKWFFSTDVSYVNSKLNIPLTSQRRIMNEIFIGESSFPNN
jgi:hypothetical protein